MKLPLMGIARVVVVAGVGLGLIAVAQADPRSIAVAAGTAAEQATADPATAASIVPLTSRLVSCAGQELTGTSGVPDVTLTGTVSAVSLPEALRPTGVTGDGTLTIASGTTSTDAVTGPGQRANAPLPTGPDAVTAKVAGALAPGLTVGQEWSSDTDTLRGLAGTQCPTAAADQWLIAGGGAPGRQERLVLANPGANEVSATIDILGAQGALTRSADRGVVVPAGGRAVVLIDALAASEPTPVVHVTVSGGTVSATLTDTWLDGSIPAGAETTGPTAPPALTQVIPIARLQQGGGLRIAVPGADQAVVSARLLTAQGPVPVSTDEGGVARIQGRSVLQLPLPAGAEGLVGVEVTADVPVIAAAVSVARADGAVGDFAWSAGAPAITTLTGAALVGGGPQRQLNLVATGGEVQAQVLTLEGGSVVTKEVTIAADTTVTTDLGSPDGVWVVRTSGAGELRAGLAAQVGAGETALISTTTLADLPLTTAATSAVPLP